MRHRVVSILLILLVASVLWGTWFVVVAGPPAWVDPNVIGDDQVLVREVSLGQTIQFGTEPDTRPEVRIQYNVLSVPAGMVYTASNPNDPNQANNVTFEWTPSAIGVYYARVQATVVKPYESGQETYSIALRVQKRIEPLLKWWFKITGR